MGQKVSPVGLRIGVNKDWNSKWFATKDYATYLHEDIKIRDLLNNSLKEAVISKIEIEKTKTDVTVHVSALKPAVILGQDGSNVKALSKKIAKIAHGKNVKINVDNYSSVCKNYKDSTLYLLINATDENDKVTSYKIPLILEENCNNQKLN